MDRRTLVMSAPLLPLAGMASATQADPHPQWLSDWRKAEKYWMGFEEDSPEEKAAWGERERLSQLLCVTPATTAEGLLAQVQWFREDLEYVLIDMLGAPYNDAIGVLEKGLTNLVATTARAKGKVSLPPLERL